MSDNVIIDPTTIHDINGEQDHATVPSVLAMAPDNITAQDPVTMEQVRQFMLDQEQDKDKQEAKRDGDKVANYYFDRLQMDELEEHLRIEFPNTWRNKFRMTENFTKSVSRQLSSIYKKKPKREAINSRISSISDAELKIQSELINFVYEHGKIDRAYQEIERFAKWSRSVLIEVIYQPKTSKIILKPYSPQFYDVMVSKSGILQAVIISDYQIGRQSDKDLKGRNFWAWTDTEFQHFQGPDLTAVGEVEENPLGRLPFVFYNDDLPVENEKPYLHADTTLANTNLAINRLLTDAMSLVKNKTYGQPYTIGIDPDKSAQPTGHEVIWNLQPKNEGQQVEVGVLSPSGDLEAILQMIERTANGYATTRGMAPDTFTAVKTGKTADSGVALKIKNHVLLDMRDGEESKYQDLESEIFNVVRDVHNFNADAEGGHDLPEINEDLKLSVHFDDNSLAFENPAQIRQMMLLEVNQGLLKLSDFVRASRPHFSEEEAEEYLKQVEEQRVRLGLSPSMEAIDKALNATGDENDEDDEEEEEN